jgi:hypothetical protein
MLLPSSVSEHCLFLGEQDKFLGYAIKMQQIKKKEKNNHLS